MTASNSTPGIATEQSRGEDLLAAAPLPILAPVLIYFHGEGFVAAGLDGYDTLFRARV